MPDDKVRVELEGLDGLVDEIEDKIETAAVEAGSEAASQGRRAANDHIRNKGRVMSGGLTKSWTPIRRKTPLGTHVTGFQNNANHAPIIDKGHQYSKKPNFDNIRDAVAQKYPHVKAQGTAELNRVAHGVMLKIYEDGIKGINFSDVFKDRMETVFYEQFSKELEKQ